MHDRRVFLRFAVTTLLGLLVVIAASPLGAAPGGGAGAPFVPGEVLLQFRAGTDAATQGHVRAALGATTLHTFASSAQHWRLAPGMTVAQALDRLRANPQVAYAEPNYMLSAAVTPDDPRYPELWGLNNTGQTGGSADADIDADMAWGVSTGSPNVVVGVIDTGIDYNHPDLAANVWTNPGEIAGNGIDDDGNGYVDDIHGWDFVNNDNDPFDDHGHGTHVSGTITGIGNNGIGVAGVAWHVKVMALKFLDSGGSGSTANAVLAVDYANSMHVDLTSNSWGGGSFSQALYDAIARANALDIAFVAAAGNNGVDNDTSPHYPCSYNLPNVISVAATDDADQLASFSNWGAVSVDLAAPGVDILSTLPGNSYGLLSGTSMATPHVSGTCALIRSVSPHIPVAQLKNVLLNAVDHIPAVNGKVFSNGRLNAFFAIAEPDDVAPGQIGNLATESPGSNTMGLRWTATGDDGAVGTATYYEIRFSKDPLTEANFELAPRAGNEPTPTPAGTVQVVEVRNLAASTFYYFALRAIDEWGNRGPVSNVATGETLPPPTGQVDPSAFNEALFTGQQVDRVATLTNVGLGTLDFTIPPPSIGQPLSAPPPPLDLGKDDVDPRTGGPVAENRGGPDTFGYRWIDSDEPGGPVFSWTDISTTGQALGITADDATSPPVALGFSVPFYGTFFDSIRVCTNGWLSFTSTATSYSNQPLPNSGAPENFVAPLWDDLSPKSVDRIYFQSFGNKAIVQWNAIERYSGTGSYTFQAILDSSGSITFQYLTVSGTLDSATVGIQDASKTTGLQVAFNQAYLHDNLAVRITAIPQWLTAGPTSGRLYAGQSIPISLHVDASGLEGGTYPAEVDIVTNDPAHPVLPISVTLVVTGAPDIEVQPPSIAYGDVFVSNPATATLLVANNGTDVLHVTGIASSTPDLVAAPAVFDVPAHGSQAVIVTWTPPVLGAFTGTLTISSNDAADPALVVPVTGNSVTAPVMLVSPSSFEETLFSGNTLTRPLTVQNTGGSDLVVDAAADLGAGILVSTPPEGTTGSGGPDAFGYRWKDSDASGGPAYDFVDISATGTQITFSSQDDALSAAINMGMTFPFYGANFSSLKVSTNGWLTFDTTDTSTRLTNYNLPSTSGAKNMIALFWDDLHLRTGNVKYLYDGSRFIVQYTNVEKYSPSGFPLTFQVQLYPNGKVLMQYQTMAGTLNSATIGIQDGTRAIGLTANYNVNYVHGAMAINFSRVPDWLSVTPNHKVIAPGGSFDFSVTFDSNQRNGGDLGGAVVLTTNIPTQPLERVPALLHVVGAPIVGVVPASFDYGTRYTGYPYLTTMQILNVGTDVLNVSDVFSDDPALFVEEPQSADGHVTAGFAIPPGGSRLFNLRWAPVLAGPLAANVHVLSDDPVTPHTLMPVTGLGILPPVAFNTPDAFSESMDPNQVLHRTLRLENHGGSDLTFSARVALDTGVSVPVYEGLDLKKDEIDPREGLLGSGGPDAYGYMWRDSGQPGGPVYEWVDISAVGTPITALTGDDQSASVPIGFDFPFYGASFNTVNVKTNGFLSFTSTATNLTNNPLPNTSAPENLLAVFWDDLHFRGTPKARYYNDGTRFIVEYDHVDRYQSTTPSDLTFQVILYPSGRIVYQFHSMISAELASATIGIQNAAKTDGLTVVYNSAYVHDALAVEFSPPFIWPAVSPASGTIPAGGGMDLDVLLDASGLVGGDYNSTISIQTNDPARALFDVPVLVHVTGIPDVAVSPEALAYPTTFVGFTSSQALSLVNTGSDTLHVTDLLVSGEFSVSGASLPLEIRAGRSTSVTVVFAPQGDGPRSGVLTVVSDDPDEAQVFVPLGGTGLFPPEIHVTPPQIHTALPPGGHRTKKLTVANQGGSDLTWDTATNMLSALGSTAPGTYLDLAKDEADPREGTLGSGGPDLYGYSWVDSDETGGPVYEWVDIAATGTPIGALTGDDQSAVVPIGFAFPFYGGAFTDLHVSTNGFVSFTSTLTAYSNQPLPNTGSTVPENMIALFWDDLHFRSGVHAYTQNDATRFILQYENVERYTTGSFVTAQMILFPNGRILLQYKSVGTVANSATIGMQNAARDDGFTVVYNANYLHDAMAIEIRKIPEWLKVNPTAGTVAAHLSQDLDLLVDAEGLEDGQHEALVKVRSNDPYNPLVEVPVSLNVSLIEPTLTEFLPKIIRRSETTFRVRVRIELPAGLDPRAIPVSSVTLNDTVPALANPAPYFTDDNRNGIEEVTFWFDGELVSAALGEGQDIPVTIMGEVLDVQWWRGTDVVRTGDPDQYMPVPGAWYPSGQAVPVRWNPASEATGHLYNVLLSRDGGATFETLAAGLTGTQFDWTATGPRTANALVRVDAYDLQGTLLGQDLTKAPFTIGAASVMPPFPIDGGTLSVVRSGAFVQFDWKTPPTDPTHAPADRYRVLRGASPLALAEVATPADTRYSEDSALTAAQPITFYRIVAANAAGDEAP